MFPNRRVNSSWSWMLHSGTNTNNTTSAYLPDWLVSFCLRFKALLLTLFRPSERSRKSVIQWLALVLRPSFSFKSARRKDELYNAGSCCERDDSLPWLQWSEAGRLKGPVCKQRKSGTRKSGHKWKVCSRNWDLGFTNLTKLCRTTQTFSLLEWLPGKGLRDKNE